MSTCLYQVHHAIINIVVVCFTRVNVICHEFVNEFEVKCLYVPHTKTFANKRTNVLSFLYIFLMHHRMMLYIDRNSLLRRILH